MLSTVGEGLMRALQESFWSAKGTGGGRRDEEPFVEGALRSSSFGRVDPSEVGFVASSGSGYASAILGLRSVFAGAACRTASSMRLRTAAYNTH